jgi:hypothetical protein
MHGGSASPPPNDGETVEFHRFGFSEFQKYSNPNREGLVGMFVQSFENWLEW